MGNMKEFFRNISKTGWIVVSLVIVVILLIIIGILSAKNGMDWWPFNNGSDSKEWRVDSENGNENLLANVDRALQSAEDSVLSVEDVLSGAYNNDYESATVFIRNTVEIPVAVLGTIEAEEVATSTCGEIQYVITRVPNKPGIINESMKALFSDKVNTDFEPGNVITRYHQGLVFDNAVLESGVAKIYLRGSLTEDAVCGADQVVAQIEATVKQFDTVESVEIYQNLNKIN
jgi:hypothetical protein